MAEQPFRENPFAAPEAIIEPPVEKAVVVEEGTGPPWEQSGPWAKRFVETTWLCYRHPFLLFRGMRRRGSWWMPVGYALIAYVLSIAVIGALDFAKDSSVGISSEFLEYVVIGLLGFPFSVLVAAAFHIFLIATGPTDRFVATFRSVFYVVGSTSLLSAFPKIGDALGFAAGVVLQIIALKVVHRTTRLRATFVVLTAFTGAMVIAIAVYVAGILLGVFPEPE